MPDNTDSPAQTAQVASGKPLSKEKAPASPTPVASIKPNELETNETKTFAKEPGTPLEEVKKEEQLPEFFKTFDKRIADLRSSGSSIMQSFITFMDEYLKVMDPKAADEIDNDVGADFQMKFFRAIRTVVDKTKPEDFNKTWNIVLAYFWRYRSGALNERYIHRFAPYWVRNEDNLTAFQRIVNLCMLSANPAERQTVSRQADITKSIEQGFSPVGKDNLLQYYRV